eukprot:TRINITY_DN2625_c0_g1_i1.p1 TRINITY_DN2625_c0_g1~~TRINITY_DN2625_c0_g1_i1.p1  ORF type:complete len:313 (+),score=77.29 TRINITY_DN2625_c0_g1_i1:102-1040(+)
MSQQSRQSTSSVLMVSPVHFCSNPDAIVDNYFMQAPVDESQNNATTKQALAEFDSLVAALRAHKVKVNVYVPQDNSRITPDAVFPNNWFSTHMPPESSTPSMYLYPMKPNNRRLERRPEIISFLQQSYPHVVDFSEMENKNIFLEGTGSMVLDRINKVTYATISERTHIDALDMWAKSAGYTTQTFHAVDSNARPIYHTNVMMCIGTSVAIICAPSILDSSERDRVIQELSKGREVVIITPEQVSELCGNVLEVAGEDGKKYLVMSTRSFKAFTEEQKTVMLRHVSDIIHADISTIEHVGGGGVRCCLAELY